LILAKGQSLSPCECSTFFTSIEKAKAELDWQPSFDLISGLKDSLPERLRGFWARTTLKWTFSLDDQILGA
jgi:hypothetical protein